GHGGIGGIAAGQEHMQRHGAVKSARLQMRQAEMPCEPPRQRALAGRRRPVDRDDHGATGAIAAPRPFISATNPGKLVLIVSPSSMRVGFCAAMPSTRKAMAMR